MIPIDVIPTSGFMKVILIHHINGALDNILLNKYLQFHACSPSYYGKTGSVGTWIYETAPPQKLQTRWF